MDIVYSVRIGRSGGPRFTRGTAADSYRILQRLKRTSIPTDSEGFRLMSLHAVDAFGWTRERVRGQYVVFASRFSERTPSQAQGA